jgi:heptosyltransferase-2
LLDYNRLALQAGAPVESLQMELFTNRVDESQADRVWHEAGFTNRPEVIALNPGGAFGTSKLWPAEHFAELARRLVDERGSQIMVLCGPSERDLARQIVRIVNRPQVVSLADQPVSLGLTKACIRRCDLLISTDSGVRHFAAAFNKPVVALFGPTFINWTNTYFPLEIRLQRRVQCGPCQRRECHLDHRCMKDLAPSEAFRAAVQLLNRVNCRSHAEVARAA